jgi:hypothetical protein
MYVSSNKRDLPFLKRHGNEADFLGFLQKLVPHESLKLPSSRSEFGGDIPNRKTTLRLAESASRRLPDSASRESESRLMNF